jgi:hypothetical protein
MIVGSSGICVGNWIHGLAWGWCLRASRSDPSGLLRAEAFWNSRGQARRRAWGRGQFQRSSPDQSRWGPAPRAKSAPTPCQACRDPHDSLMSLANRSHQMITVFIVPKVTEPLGCLIVQYQLKDQPSAKMRSMDHTIQLAATIDTVSPDSVRACQITSS